MTFIRQTLKTCYVALSLLPVSVGFAVGYIWWLLAIGFKAGVEASKSVIRKVLKEEEP